MTTHFEERIDKQLVAELTAAFTERGSDERLHSRLEDLADREGVLDVAYRTIDSPVGTLLLAATTAGLVRVAYDVEDHDAVLTKLAAAVSPRVLRAPARLDDNRGSLSVNIAESP